MFKAVAEHEIKLIASDFGETGNFAPRAPDQVRPWRGAAKGRGRSLRDFIQCGHGRPAVILEVCVHNFWAEFLKISFHSRP